MWRNVNTSRAATFFLAFLFVLLPFLMVPSAIDPDLNPRIIAVSVFCLVSIMLFGNRPILLPDSFKKIGIISIVLILFSLLSVFSAINTGEAIAEWLRIGVIYSFLLVSVLIIRNGPFNVLIPIRFISIAVLIFCGFAIVQTIPVVKDILANKKIIISSDLASTLSNKNFFSEVLVLLIPAIFYSILNDKKQFRILHIIAFILAFFFLILLSSLACWVAMIVSVVIVGVVFLLNRSSDTLVLKKSTVIILTITSIALIAIGKIVFEKVPVAKNLLFKVEMISKYISEPDLLDKNAMSNNNSVFDRILMIRNSVKMISDHPITGVGMNNWKLLYPAYGVNGTEIINSGGMNFEHPHNDYLLIFAEQGIFGILIYIFFFFFVFNVWRMNWKSTTPSDRAILLVILFVISSFLIMSLFSYPRSRIYSPVLLMFFISWLFVKRDSSNSVVNEHSPNEIENSNYVNTKTFVLKRVYSLTVILICLFATIVTAIRLDSEISAKKMIKAKFQNNFARVIRESEKINLYFYPLEYASTSIEWYKGMALFYSGKIPAALTLYQKAILKTPYHLRTLNDLATAYEQTGQPDSAISFYKRALAISPNLFDSRLNLSATYFNQNKIDSAYDVLNFIEYKKLNIGPNENYVKFMSVILAAKINDSLASSKDSVMIYGMNQFVKDIERTKKYIRTYKGRTIWPDVFTDIK